VGQWPHGLDALLLKGDRGRLDGADPDGQITHAIFFAEQDDRLVGREFDPNSDNSHRMHDEEPPAQADSLTIDVDATRFGERTGGTSAPANDLAEADLDEGGMQPN
jgi:hypothetical protein